MRLAASIKTLTVVLVILSFTLNGCGIASAPAPKQEIGPTGKAAESKSKLTFLERFYAAPPELYDLEATAGVMFEGLTKKDWTQVQAGLNNLQTLWSQAKSSVGEKKGVKQADESLLELTAAIHDRKVTAVYEYLIKFMGSISDIGESYKLSPIADIIAVSNAIRNVSFYVEDQDWSKAAAKIQELEGTWRQVKPSMERIGILGEITKTHSAIDQVKDAINAENKSSFLEQQGKLNESMGRIREFYRSK